MNDPRAHETAQRQLALLKKLQGRAIAPAAEHFAATRPLSVSENSPAAPDRAAPCETYIKEAAGKGRAPYDPFAPQAAKAASETQGTISAAQEVAEGGIAQRGRDADLRRIAGGKPRINRFARIFPEIETLGGAAPCHRLRSAAPLDGVPTRQGYRCPVEHFGGVPDPAALAALTGEAAWNEVDPERIVFIDTETTGLGGGSGVVAFLAGLGRFDGAQFRVDQFAMDDYDAEAAMLDAMEAALADAQAIVSYNGRTFDIPLLETRWRMHRRRAPFPALHLDLLHYSRRLWKRRLPGCSLGEVERSILGLRRLSDVPGAFVAGIYLDFIAGRFPERIVPVFDHHAQDIFSLAPLAALFAHAVTQPDHPALCGASDQWGLGRLHAARGRPEAATARMESAVLMERDAAQSFRMAMQLARHYKRMGRAEEALAIWTARAAESRPGEIEPLVELAKHAEHAARDYEEARRWTERALAALEQSSLCRDDAEASQRAKDRAALAQRLGRLHRKRAAPRRAASSGKSGAEPC